MLAQVVRFVTVQANALAAFDIADARLLRDAAVEKNMQTAMREIDALDVVKEKSQLIRIEEEVNF